MYSSYSTELEEFIRKSVTTDRGVLQARDFKGQTALHFAVRHGRVQLTETLLEAGADVNVADQNGMTPLLYAVQESKGIDELLSLLMKRGADVLAKDHSGQNALHHLTRASGDNTDVVRAFISMGVSLHEGDSKEYQPIHWAAQWGNNELVKLFLDHGANVNARTKFESIHPLYLAAMNQNPAVLETLIGRGADTRLKTMMRGRTALHAACVDCREENIRALFTAGADMFVEDDQGETPFGLMKHRNLENPSFRLMIRLLALKTVLLRPSIKSKDERSMARDPKMWNYYIDCFRHVHLAKVRRINKKCKFIQLLAQCPCSIAALLRNPEFEAKFALHDLDQFSMYAEDMRRAFQLAKRYHRFMLEREDAINEAVYHILPDLVVRKVVRYLCNYCFRN